MEGGGCGEGAGRAGRGGRRRRTLRLLGLMGMTWPVKGRVESQVTVTSDPAASSTAAADSSLRPGGAAVGAAAAAPPSPRPRPAVAVFCAAAAQAARGPAASRQCRVRLQRIRLAQTAWPSIHCKLRSRGYLAQSCCAAILHATPASAQ